MNEYKLENIRIGMTEEFNVKITQKMQDDFRNICGDINPLHSDEKFAQEKGFENTLVFGMLTVSFFSTLVGVYLPGKNCLFQECKNIMFHNPVFIGDELNIKGEVKEIDARFNRIIVKAIIRNQDGKKVCSGNLIAGIR